MISTFAALPRGFDRIVHHHRTEKKWNRFEFPAGRSFCGRSAKTKPPALRRREPGEDTKKADAQRRPSSVERRTVAAGNVSRKHRVDVDAKKKTNKQKTNDAPARPSVGRRWKRCRRSPMSDANNNNNNQNETKRNGLLWVREVRRQTCSQPAAAVGRRRRRVERPLLATPPTSTGAADGLPLRPARHVDDPRQSVVFFYVCLFFCCCCSFSMPTSRSVIGFRRWTTGTSVVCSKTNRRTRRSAAGYFRTDGTGRRYRRLLFVCLVFVSIFGSVVALLLRKRIDPSGERFAFVFFSSEPIGWHFRFVRRRAFPFRHRRLFIGFFFAPCGRPLCARSFEDGRCSLSRLKMQFFSCFFCYFCGFRWPPKTGRTGSARPIRLNLIRIDSVNQNTNGLLWRQGFQVDGVEGSTPPLPPRRRFHSWNSSGCPSSSSTSSSHSSCRSSTSSITGNVRFVPFFSVPSVETTRNENEGHIVSLT